MYQTKTALQKAIGAIKILPHRTQSEIDRVLSLYSLKRKDISMFSEILARDIESSDGLTRYDYIPENADLPDNELLASLAGDFESSDGQFRHGWTAVQSKKGRNYAFQLK